jgi:hypothetical protein
MGRRRKVAESPAQPESHLQIPEPAGFILQCSVHPA